MPLRRSLLISALLHTMLLWGAFASSLPLKEHIFFVEIAEAPSAPEAARPAQPAIKDIRPAAGAESRIATPVPQQDSRQPVEQRSAVPEPLPRLLPEEAGGTGTTAAEDARPITSVSAGLPASTSTQSGGGDHVARQGRPLVLHSGSGGNSEHLLGQLRSRIERAIVYPPLARKRRMEGAVTVSFTVSEGGIPADLRLLRDSGYRLLDEEALNTVKRASPLPAIRGTVEIPIRFRLSDHE